MRTCRIAFVQVRASEQHLDVLPSSRVSNTVYVREPLSEGSTIISQSDCGVVVFGDVPKGASIAAGGDVIVMGW